MNRLTLTVVVCCIAVTSCNTSKPAPIVQVSSSPSPLPIVQVKPSPTPMSPKQHWEAFKEIFEEKIHSPEEYAEMRMHLTEVANSKAAERQRASKALKVLLALEADTPVGDALKSAQQICADISGDDIAVLTDQLKKSLHDPSSLQDFKVKKCVPNGARGQDVTLIASYRAKNAYGALTLNEDQFLAVRSTDGKTKYKALVWVSEK